MAESMATRLLQAELVAAGFDPGGIDGVAGPRTRAAVRALQAAHGLAVDGVVGPHTRAALAAVPAWMRVAGQLVGTREAAGGADNPAILGWAQALGIAYAGDSVPWCGLFVAHCLASAPSRDISPGVTLPPTPLWARSWARFGVDVAPVPGAIMVFRRGAVGGHVGFHTGETDDAFRILGGNQGDGVSLAWLARSRLLASRWPAGTLLPTVRPVATARRTGALSTNEG